MDNHAPLNPEQRRRLMLEFLALLDQGRTQINHESLNHSALRHAAELGRGLAERWDRAIIELAIDENDAYQLSRELWAYVEDAANAAARLAPDA